MKLIILILLMNCIYIFGQIYKTQLRGMYKEQLDELIEASIVNDYETIYNKIIENAKKGINKYQFTIMCSELGSGSNCKLRNGHQVWTQTYPNNIISTTNSYITIEQYTTSIIDMLNSTFPDSNITNKYKNCCDYHIIKW